MKNRKTTLIFLALSIISIMLIVCCEQNKTEYTTFLGEKHFLMVQESEEIILLYPDNGYNKHLLGEILEKYDEVFRLFEKVSDEERTLYSGHGEKLSLAVVAATCGSGCGRLGTKGIEITESKFSQIYNLYMDSARQDHLFFYELGRNFWFYEEILTYPGSILNDDIRTGFAVFMRNVAIRELGVDMGDINGIPYEKYMENNHKMWERYLTDSTAMLENTFFVEKNTGRQVSFNRPNLWAAFWWDLYSREGYDMEFLKTFLKKLKNQNKPESEEGIFLNFYRAACNTTNKNLYNLFVHKWKWNISCIH